MRNYHEQAQLAHRLAEKVHICQRDKNGDPYMEHVTRVASAAMKHAQSSDFHTVSKLYIVGLLHDTIEDCEFGLPMHGAITVKKFRDEIAEQIILEQGPEIYVAVEALTHRAWVSEPYAKYIDRVKANMLATEVKLEDLRDNFNPERALRLASVSSEDFTRVVDVLIPRYIRAYDYLTH